MYVSFSTLYLSTLREFPLETGIKFFWVQTYLANKADSDHLRVNRNNFRDPFTFSLEPHSGHLKKKKNRFMTKHFQNEWHSHNPQFY